MANPRTSRSFFLWGAVAASVALVAAMAALLLIAYGPNPAQAAGDCSTTSGTTTCTYGPTGKEDTFEVPQGVSTIHVVATGAPGAVGVDGGAAGSGATVSGDLRVFPGQTLYVNVGGAPTGPSGTCAPRVDCIGGFNGGGSSLFGAGGGGASDVRTVSRTQSVSLSYRLIVAGGGGGSGIGLDDCQGGKGGDAGSDGGDVACEGSLLVPGGQGGGLLAGGAGGDPVGDDGQAGESGVLGQGGDGGSDQGGGGGGGLFGGGGGGADAVPLAGGGGGGSNLVPPGGPAASIASGDPSVTISYQASVGEPPPTEPENKQACQKGGWKDFGFKNQGACLKAVNHPS